MADSNANRWGALFVAAAITLLIGVWVVLGRLGKAPEPVDEPIRSESPSTVEAAVASVNDSAAAVRDQVGGAKASASKFLVRVRRQDGTPCVGAVIARGAPEAFVIGDEDVLAIADEAGEAPIQMNRLGDCSDVVVSQRGLVPLAIRDVCGGTTYDVTLGEGEMLVVRVVDDGGSACPGIRLAALSSAGAIDATGGDLEPLSRWTSRGPLLATGVTDESGRAVFRGMKAGTYAIIPRDPGVMFTLESRVLAGQVGLPGPEVQLEIVAPLVALWRYVDCDAVHCSFSFGAVGGRDAGEERRLGSKFDGARAVVVSGENKAIEPLTVTAVLRDGSCIEHHVPFVSYPRLAAAHEVFRGQTRLLAEAGARLIVRAGDAWGSPELLHLYLEVIGGEPDGLKSVRITPNEPIHVPAGSYVVREALGMLAKDVPVTIAAQPDQVELEVELRRDVARVMFDVRSRSGRRVILSGRVRTGERRTIRCVLDSAAAAAMPLKVGSYTLRYSGLGVSESVVEFAVEGADLATEKRVEVVVDDR